MVVCLPQWESGCEREASVLGGNHRSRAGARLRIVEADPGALRQAGTPNRSRRDSTGGDRDGSQYTGSHGYHAAEIRQRFASAHAPTFVSGGSPRNASRNCKSRAASESTRKELRDRGPSPQTVGHSAHRTQDAKKSTRDQRRPGFARTGACPETRAPALKPAGKLLVSDVHDRLQLQLQRRRRTRRQRPAAVAPTHNFTSLPPPAFPNLPRLLLYRAELR